MFALVMLGVVYLDVLTYLELVVFVLGPTPEPPCVTMPPLHHFPVYTTPRNAATHICILPSEVMVEKFG